MFQLSLQNLDTGDLRRTLLSPAAGAFAGFEGWVRDHNDGKEVVALEYEAFERLARKEAEAILGEARQKFAIIDVHCRHRTGRLNVGEMAVWVGVTAEHRDSAFAACRYVIDEIKHRLPIWKKEYYADGNSGWVNCKGCAHPSGV